ncbi:MAG: SRPBCC domain-containing protein, partial [Thermomicrobiales bacterium]|nr:SRPBCC domain-containing protein [Thermomicrobiales bacterium]
MSPTLHTEIVIAAPATTVWAVLTDFAAYPAWNPFIRRITGQLEPGAKLEVELAPPGGRSTTIRPTVCEAQPEKTFRWLG